MEQLVALGNAVKEGDVYKVNFADLGADKLLGTGNPVFKFEIVVAAATKGAIEKVEAAGGSVSLLAKEVPAEPTEE